MGVDGYELLHRSLVGKPRVATLAERLAAIDEPLSDRIHRALGPSATTYDAIMAHTPADAVIVTRGPSDRLHMLTMRALTTLCAPRRFVVPKAAARTVQPPYFLLSFAPGDSAPSAAGGAQRVAGDERFTLDAIAAIER